MPGAPRHNRAAPLLLFCGSLAVALAVAMGVAAHDGSRARPPALPSAAEQDTAVPRTRDYHVVARKYTYSVPRIEVQQDDLVKITLESADIPHSFTLDEPYRIAKRATPGHPVVFEFRADKAGTFDFYCNLKADEGCRAMKGQLIVTPKR